MYQLYLAMEPTSLCVRRRLCELVEYVEVTLILHLTYHAALLEQIVRDLRSNGLSVVVEHDLEILSLSRSQQMMSSAYP